MILERLKQYIDFKGMTIAAFERSVGMSNASFGKSLKQGTSIGSDKLEKILSIYPDLDAEWLMRGKGDMLVTVTAANDTLRSGGIVPAQTLYPNTPFAAPTVSDNRPCYQAAPDSRGFREDQGKGAPAENNAAESGSTTSGTGFQPDIRQGDAGKYEHRIEQIEQEMCEIKILLQRVLSR